MNPTTQPQGLGQTIAHEGIFYSPDGKKYTRYGNTIFASDGRRFVTHGEFTAGSDRSLCRHGQYMTAL